MIDTAEQYDVYVGSKQTRSFESAPEACIYAAARYGGGRESVTVYFDGVCVWEDGAELTI